MEKEKNDPEAEPTISEKGQLLPLNREGGRKKGSLEHSQRGRSLKKEGKREGLRVKKIFTLFFHGARRGKQSRTLRAQKKEWGGIGQLIRGNLRNWGERKITFRTRGKKKLSCFLKKRNGLCHCNSVLRDEGKAGASGGGQRKLEPFFQSPGKREKKPGATPKKP